MFSDYLVIIQTSKDKGGTVDWITLYYVNVYEKKVPIAMVNLEKSANFAEISPILYIND